MSERMRLGRSMTALSAVFNKLEKSKVIKLQSLSKTIYSQLLPTLMSVCFLPTFRGKGFNIRENTIKCYDPKKRDEGWIILPPFQNDEKKRKAFECLIPEKSQY